MFNFLATVTLPETGIDIPGWITVIIAALGAIVAVSMGGYCAFLLVRKAMGWVRNVDSNEGESHRSKLNLKIKCMPMYNEAKDAGYTGSYDEFMDFKKDDR